MKKRRIASFGLILAGGQSSRLFPFNKVLSDLTGSGRTLIQQAADRTTRRGTDGAAPIARTNLYVLTSSSVVPAMSKQLRLPVSRFLVDPVRRGTWPALLWAMAHLRRSDPDATVAVLTADHLIPNIKAFRRSVRQALDLAQRQSAMVMIGVEPSTKPEDWVGFGCFRQDQTAILSFEEKPSLARATAMIADGGWRWNAGMFFFKISTAERALETYQPAMAKTYAALVQAVASRQLKKAATIYEDFPAKITHPRDPARDVDNTIDYAIMTPLVYHAQQDLVAAASADSLREWADVGEWTTLRRHVKPDPQGNVRIGRVTCDKTVRDCIIAADSGRRIDAKGIENVIVAFSGDRALVLPMAEAAQIKPIVSAQPGWLVSSGAASLTIRRVGSTLRIRPTA